MLVSSANKNNFSLSDILGRSLMYIKKSKGPKTEPWGTPQDIPLRSEDEPLK